MCDEKNTGTNLPAEIEIERDRRRRLQVPVHGQGRRLGQQELPVPGDQGAAERDDAAAVVFEKIRTLGTAACPPYHLGIVDRRHLGRARAEDGQARVGRATSTRCRPAGTHARPRVPRRRARGAGARSSRRQTGIGAQFGGKYFCHDVRVIRLPRHGASCPVAHRRVVLGRPPGPRQDHRRRRVPRAARDRPRAATCPRSPTSDLEGADVVADRPQPADERDPRRAVEVPGEDPRDADRPDGRRPRHRPRQDQGAPRRRRAACREYLQGPLRLLRRPGQDARGLRVGLVRPDDRRPHGLLRRPVPGRRRQLRDARQGQPLEGGHRRVQGARRLLPRLDRRPRGPPRPGLHHARSRCSSTPSSAWRPCGRSRS